MTGRKCSRRLGCVMEVVSLFRTYQLEICEEKYQNFFAIAKTTSVWH